MSQLVKYGSYELEAVEEEEDIADRESESEFLKFREGRNVVRILPPLPPNRSPFQVTHEHRINIPGVNVPIRFLCPRLMERRDCPACDESARLRRSPSATDRDSGFSMKASRRVYANVIDRRDPEAGVRVMAFGKKIHDRLIEIRKDREEGGDYTDPTERGFDIVIKRSGKDWRNTEYSVGRSIRMSPLHEDVVKANEWLEDQYDLAAYAKVPTLDEIRAAMDGDNEVGRGGRDRGQSSERSRGGRERGEQSGRDRREGGRSEGRGRRRTAEDDVIDCEDYDQAKVVDAEFEEVSKPDPFDGLDDLDDDIPY